MIYGNHRATNLGQLFILRIHPLILIHRATRHARCDQGRAQKWEPQPEQVHLSKEHLHQAAHVYICFLGAMRQFASLPCMSPLGSPAMEVFVVKPPR